MSHNLPSLPSASALTGAELYYAVQNGNDVKVLGSDLGLIRAGSNISFSVNPAGQYPTLQGAINAAAGYNWNGLYHPIIGGTTVHEQIHLPPLINCPDGGVISSLTITDLGTDYAVTAEPGSAWSIPVLTTAGTYGGINVGPFAWLVTSTMTIGGNLAFDCFNLAAQSLLGSIGNTINITATAARNLVFSRGEGIFDQSTITFANAITFSQAVIQLDSSYSFLGIFDTQFVNGGNVTVSGSNSASIVNGAFLETSSNTKVDGSLLARNNFPGGKGVFTDLWSVYQPDNALNIVSASTDASNIILNNTTSGGKSYSYGSTGSANGFGPGLFQLFNNTDFRGILVYQFSGGADSITLPNTLVLGWDGATQFGVPGLRDIGLARNAAGVVEANNGTRGTLADFLARTHRTTALAFASLPTGVEGMMCAISDSSTAVWGANIAGGGANHVLGYFNGANWTVAAK